MIHALTAAMLIAIGYMVRFKQWSWLIAGYNTSSKDEKDTYDTEALCSGVGNAMFVLGGIVLIGSLGEFLRIAWLWRISWVMFSVVTVIFLVYANTGNRFKK